MPNDPAQSVSQPLSDDDRKRREKKEKKRTDSFWRAARYLGPHRKLVFISIFCALVVGVAFTSGLSTIVPIMHVLLYDDSIENYANRQVVEQRLKLSLHEDADVNSTELAVLKVPKEGPATDAGLKPRDTLVLAELVNQPGAGPATLRALSDPSRSAVNLIVNPDRNTTRPLSVQLQPIPKHVQWVRGLADLLPANRLHAIAAVLGFLVALAVFGNVVRFFQEYYSEKASILAVRDVRMHVYDHSLHLPLEFYGTRGTSDLTSRLTQDAQGLQEGLKNLLGNSIQEPIKAACALGLALYFSWELTLFIIAFGPVMAVLIKKFGKKMRRAARSALQNSSLMLGQIEGSLSGIRVVKSTNAERFERRRFRRIVGELVEQHKKIAKMEAFNTPMLEMFTLFVVCGIVLYASYLVLGGSLKPTTFFLVMGCLMGIGESLRKVGKINNVIQKSNAAAARLFELIDDHPGERPWHKHRLIHNKLPLPPRPKVVLPPIQREVRFEHLTFAYPNTTVPALRDVSLTVKKGMSIAVVGRNGSGKTTLLAMLPRFFRPDSGRVLIDGIDVVDATLPSLRRQIGIVTQDSIIFPGTIHDNIAYANPLATRDQVIAAAKQAFAHDFILEKPQGYDTLLGEHGAQLSGGQKQRLCIARAIARNTPILILDEATSQVDAESEHLIQQAIERLMHERTTFVIAHRFSTIKSADLIVVMDRGQIVGAGSHDELLRTCPTYQQLYERQLIGAGTGV